MAFNKDVIITLASIAWHLIWGYISVVDYIFMVELHDSTANSLNNTKSADQTFSCVSKSQCVDQVKFKS